MAAPRHRLGVSVESASLKSAGAVFVKLTVGGLKEKSPKAAGPKPAFDFYASFEVEDVAKDELKVAVLRPGALGAKDLGHVVIPVSAAAWKAGEALPAAATHALLDGHGKATGCEVTLRLILVEAPAPDTPLRVLVGTWNVGNEAPCAQLAPWLRNEGDAADLVAVGAQECTYTPRAPHASCDADWVAALAGALGASYVRVRADVLGQMRLVVFARLDTLAGVTLHESGSEATGLGHVHSNKGGVAAVVSVWDTSCCFVNAHLAAHQNKAKRRNEDYGEIVAGCDMGERGMDFMNQFHHLIWVGDLNYRLDLSDLFGEEAANAKTPPAELFDNISASVAQGAFGPLLACDQLVRARARGDAWVGFQEGTITHAPTFKVKRAPGLQYNTQRSPAYCDRILWRSLPGLTATQEALWAAPELDSSDHKPLTALHGHGLMAADYNGKSDPYVAFMGVPLPKMAVTQVVFATLDPTWSPDKLPTIRLAAPDAEALAHDFILVNVVDYDSTSADDPIGCGVLSCGELLAACAAGGGEADFEVPLTYAGMAQGKLSGRVRLSPGLPMTLAELAAGKRRTRRIAPKKRFSFSRALGLKKDEQIVVHPPSQRMSQTKAAGGGHGHGAAPAPAAKEAPDAAEDDDEEDD